MESDPKLVFHSQKVNGLRTTYASIVNGEEVVIEGCAKQNPEDQDWKAQGQYEAYKDLQKNAKSIVKLALSDKVEIKDNNLIEFLQSLRMHSSVRKQLFSHSKKLKKFLINNNVTV